jgi:hypothetical protein
MNPDQAATIALKGLAYLVNSRAELDRFLNMSGADHGTLRERADEPEFLAALLDFMLANEQVLVDFCSDSQTDVRAVHMARHALSGG